MILMKGGILTKIDMLGFFTTNRCNLKCIYCSTNAGKTLKNELSLEEKKYIVKQAKSLRARLISLHGSGEPLLDKDFFKLVKYIKSLNIQILLVTNGTLIDKRIAKWLYKNKVFILFKLNSFNKDITDLLVDKKNAYAWVKHVYRSEKGMKTKHIPSGLKNLIDVGYAELKKNKFYTYPFQVQCIISKHNYKEIPEITEFCKDNNIFLFLDRIIPDGRALINHGKLCPNERQYRWLHRKLVKILGLRFIMNQKSVLCTLKGNPLIEANGNMRYCVHRPGIIGNIRTDDFKGLCQTFKRLHRKESLSWKIGILNKHFKTCAGREYLKKKYKLKC